jgi:hypothetical protein
LRLVHRHGYFDLSGEKGIPAQSRNGNARSIVEQHCLVECGSPVGARCAGTTLPEAFVWNRHSFMQPRYFIDQEGKALGQITFHNKIIISMLTK